MSTWNNSLIDYWEYVENDLEISEMKENAQVKAFRMQENVNQQVKELAFPEVKLLKGIRSTKSTGNTDNMCWTTKRQ